MACLVYWVWIKLPQKTSPMYLKETTHPPGDWEQGSVNTRGAWKLLLSWERRQSQTLSALPSSLAPFLCPVQSRGLWLEVILSAVRQWAGPGGWQFMGAVPEVPGCHKITH